MSQPTVTCVIATRGGREDLLRRAIRSVMAQDYQGTIETVVVFDRVEVDPLDDVIVLPGRSLRTITNDRTPGLAGGRNTGILAATGDLVAFCDDDDEWRPTKTRRQLHLLADNPDAVLVAASIEVITGGQSIVRTAPARAEHADFLTSRITEYHPSGFMLRREDLLGPVGLVDELVPGSFGEDYELLLRATNHGPVVACDGPLVVVHWDRPSFFTSKWQTNADGLAYIVGKYPEIRDDRTGLARIAGQIAFACALAGNHKVARRWAATSLRAKASSLRAWGALAVSSRVVSGPWLVRTVNAHGKGL
ncbi:glycosyltransferase family 2 protein [Nocardioides albus]|uniref:Glycosyltransferase involved in cell wall biosynthesis n=1 Tax=Nocardioides albus TaxID=1841 RepID=A0A7W5FAS7_9ACTN|nr:glycosyltransferase [Nocardioides albus]MBB3091482.1 glycosyltransferase involved in cell wall biosynthesis [Nocardioides albus]GGU41502.1 hypothetical protein GCM10007979_45950 [Nocardioides albus]